MSTEPGRVRSLAKITPEEAEGVVNIALHPAAFDGFVAWLDSRGIDLSPPIPTDDGESFRVLMPRTLTTPASTPSPQDES